MERALVGVDGSEQSMHALDWAVGLAAVAGIELVVARVFVPNQAELPPDEAEAERAEQRAQVEARCAALGAEGATVVELDGDPYEALLEAAERHDADLVVVGGQGEEGFLHVHLGSVVHHLAHHTTRPLAVVPTTASTSVGGLVVGCDGSDGSRAAVELAADLAPSLGVGVTAVFAFEPYAEWFPEDDPRNWRQRAERQLTERMAPVADAGATLEVEVDRESHPVAALARALEAGADRVAVVGTRGLGGFTGLRLGRVPLQLMHHTTAAVIIVPPAPA